MTGGVASDSCPSPLERDRCRGGGIINRGTLILTNHSEVSGNVSRYAAFGYDSGNGGGIENSNGTLTLTNSYVSGNTGGGIGGSGTLTLTRSEVSFNMGGGISGSGTLTLIGSDVSNNTGHGMFITFGDSAVSLTNSSVTGNAGEGISNSGGALTVTNSHVSGNGFAGISSFGTLTLTNSTVSGNRYGGIVTFNTAILTDCTVSGNSTEGSGGGIYNFRGTLTVTNSTIEGNFARSHGGGIYNRPADTYGETRYARILTLTNSTVSGNTAGMSGGGVDNGDTLTVTNSTFSGNTAADRGGAVDNTGTVTLTNSTLSRNASGSAAGGLFNTGTVTLAQSVLSGNTAVVNGPEAYSAPGASGPSTVVVNGFNIFGHDSTPGIVGFPPLGATDLAPAVPLANVLDPTLRYNGGPTATHALVFGSPAVDVVFGAPCVIATDQRGAPRAQDGDGDTFADCDSGAVERGQVPVQASLNSTRLACRTATCQVPVTCNLTEPDCTNEVELTVRARPRRNSAEITSAAPAPLGKPAPAAASPLVGREEMLMQLREILEQALRGERQVVFVTGEPGIGKTVLVEAFLQALDPGVKSLCGQCIEQYGQGEPYAPVLEALNSLGREAGESLLGLMQQCAPTWLMQLPWFLTEADRARLAHVGGRVFDTDGDGRIERGRRSRRSSLRRAGAAPSVHSGSRIS